MKEKNWVDCPICGSKGSMVFKSNLSENYQIKNYGSVMIAGLAGQFCKVCKDGFYTKRQKKSLFLKI